MSIRILTALTILYLGILQLAIGELPGKANMDTVRVRYMVKNIEQAASFYTKYLAFTENPGATSNFAIVSRGNLELVLSTPFGPGGAAKPMSDGRKAEPGGWNRIIISVDDLQAEVAKLRKANLHFRNDIVSGPGGSEILLDDPSGNPVELFQASRPRARARAEAKITVQNSETKPYDQTASPALTEIRLRETFSGGIDGESPVRALQVRRDDRSASLVSLQRFSGKLGGRQGTFVLQGQESSRTGKSRRPGLSFPDQGLVIFPVYAVKAALRETLEKGPMGRWNIGSSDVATDTIARTWIFVSFCSYDWSE